MTDETVHARDDDPVSAGDDEAGDDETGRDRCDTPAVDAERVRAVRGRLISVAETEAVAALFKVLADPSRCRLVAAIIEAGELCVCDLAATVEMSASNVSHHLRVLRAHGLVRARREGKMVFYAPDDDHVRVLLGMTREHVREGRAGAAARSSAWTDAPDAGLTREV